MHNRVSTLVLFTVLFVAGVAAVNKGSILLKDVQGIHLSQGKFTQGRRSSPVPQLSCVSGCEYEPSSVHCQNMGMDDTGDATWKCTDANMPSEYMFGSIAVSCEGYDYPDDPYILKGSCGLEYSIKRDPSYRRPQQQQYQQHSYQAPSYSAPQQTYGSVPHAGGTWRTAVMLVVVVLVALLVCSVLNQSGGGGGGGGGGAPGGPGFPPQNPLRNNNNAGGGNNNNDGGWDHSASSKPAAQNAYAPPQQYQQPAQAQPGFQSFGGAAPQAQAAYPQPGLGVGAAPSSGPGFWSGLGAGALGGYLMGSRNRNPGYGAGYGYGGYNQGPDPYNGWGNGGGGGGWFGGGGGGGGWGGGGGGGAGCRPAPAPAPSAAPASRPASGFGGTKRR